MISSVNKNLKVWDMFKTSNDEHNSVIEYLQKSCAQLRNRLVVEHRPERVVCMLRMLDTKNLR
jgi:hypothetical protein